MSGNTEPITTLYLVVQQGGSSFEWYPSWHDTEDDANEAIVGHAKATYSAIGPYPFEVPAIPDALLNPLLCALADAVGNAMHDATMGNFTEPVSG